MTRLEDWLWALIRITGGMVLAVFCLAIWGMLAWGVWSLLPERGGPPRPATECGFACPKGIAP
jgi:hypothetical protein